MKTSIAIAGALLCLTVTTAGAQQQMKIQRYNDNQDHRFEIVPHGGYVWTMSHDFYYGAVVGELDQEDSEYFGLNIDFNVQPGKQLRLLYRRQESDVVFRSTFDRSSTEATTEYLHIGGVGGIRQGNVLPYGTVTLGGTRYAIGNDDVWKFSMIFGLGAKVYSQGRFGLQISANFPFTFFSSGAYVGVGTGGSYVSVGGSGMGQIDVGAGLIITM